MNKKTKALTTEQYKEIIAAMREGSSFFRPNERAATALVLEGNLGLRISDILKLRPLRHCEGRRALPFGDRRAENGQAQSVHRSPCGETVH